MRSLAPGTPLILVLGMPSGMVLVRGSMASPSCDTLWFCRHFEGDTCCQTEEEVEVDANAFCSFPPDYANPAKDPSATACVLPLPPGKLVFSLKPPPPSPINSWLASFNPIKWTLW